MHANNSNHAKMHLGTNRRFIPELTTWNGFYFPVFREEAILFGVEQQCFSRQDSSCYVETYLMNFPTD